jgi:hypothetical protein
MAMFLHVFSVLYPLQFSSSSTTGLFSQLSELVRHDPDCLRQDHRLLRRSQHTMCYRWIQGRPRQQVRLSLPVRPRRLTPHQPTGQIRRRAEISQSE